MTYEYFPTGVCSRKMTIEIGEDGTILRAEVIGGCHGNLQGICRLVEGRDAASVIKTLEGIKCGNKGTSCPDQLSKALKNITSQKA